MKKWIVWIQMIVNLMYTYNKYTGNRLQNHGFNFKYKVTRKLQSKEVYTKWKSNFCIELLNYFL